MLNLDFLGLGVCVAASSERYCDSVKRAVQRCSTCLATMWGRGAFAATSGGGAPRRLQERGPPWRRSETRPFGNEEGRGDFVSTIFVF